MSASPAHDRRVNLLHSFSLIPDNFIGTWKQSVPRWINYSQIIPMFFHLGDFFLGLDVDLQGEASTRGVRAFGRPSIWLALSLIRAGIAGLCLCMQMRVSACRPLQPGHGDTSYSWLLPVMFDNCMQPALSARKIAPLINIVIARLHAMGRVPYWLCLETPALSPLPSKPTHN